MIELHTEICDMLGIEYPVFGFSHCRDVIAAISNGGGIGILGAGGMTPNQLRIEVDWLRQHCDKPFGLDILLPQSNPATGERQEMLAEIPIENIEFMEKFRREVGLPPGYRMPTGEMEMGHGGTLATQRAQVEMICSLKPAVFAGGLGMTDEVVNTCHQAGIRVIGLSGTVKQARRVANLGVDIIVAQGTEAGGHTGNIGLMTLVPAVVDAVKPKPVLAAGGITIGRQVVAALALGAQGVWTGSMWLVAHENPLEDFVKDRIVDATEVDAVLTKVYSGKQRRSLKNKFIEYWNQPGAPIILPMPFQMMYLALTNHVSSEEADRTWERLGLQDYLSTPAGQGICLIKARQSAKKILYDMISEAVEVLID